MSDAVTIAIATKAANALQGLMFRHADLEERVERALNYAFAYADHDGAHHKQHVIDRMVRELTGDGYEQWVADYEADGEFEWDRGSG